MMKSDIVLINNYRQEIIQIFGKMIAENPKIFQEYV